LTTVILYLLVYIFQFLLTAAIFNCYNNYDRPNSNSNLLGFLITNSYFNLAHSANLPEGLYILPMFFFLYLFIFLMVDFLANVAETLIEQSSPKFQDW